MAKLRFEIQGTPGNVAFATYVAATGGLQKILRELDEIISSRYLGSVRWYVSYLQSKESGLTLDVVSRVRPEVRKNVPLDAGNKVASSFVRGLDNIQNQGISPPYLSEYGLRNLQTMLHVLNKNGAHGYIAKEFDEGKEVRVSSKAEEVVRSLIPIKRTAIGSVEGKLEVISLRKSRKFIVYDALTDKAVACSFHESELEKIRMLLGCRVVVGGIVHTNIKSEPVRVDVELDSIRVLGDGPLPRTTELTAAYPTITGGLSVDEYLRSIRGD
jgi:hypothetical protein